MQTQTLQKRVASQKDKLSQLAKAVRGQQQEYGRDSEVHKLRPTVDAVNWNKGWGKYGKT